MNPTELNPLMPAWPGRALTAAEFRGLAAVPPELEWFANLPNPRTRCAYQQDVRDFTACVGITRPEDFRTVTCAHLIAWRKDLETRQLAPKTVLFAVADSPQEASGAVLPAEPAQAEPVAGPDSLQRSGP